MGHVAGPTISAVSWKVVWSSKKRTFFGIVSCPCTYVLWISTLFEHVDRERKEKCTEMVALLPTYRTVTLAKPFDATRNERKSLRRNHSSGSFQSDIPKLLVLLSEEYKASSRLGIERAGTMQEGGLDDFFDTFIRDG